MGGAPTWRTASRVGDLCAWAETLTGVLARPSTTTAATNKAAAIHTAIDTAAAVAAAAAARDVVAGGAQPSSSTSAATPRGTRRLSFHGATSGYST